MLISIETYRTCYFPGGGGVVRTGSVHDNWHCNSLLWCLGGGPNANFYRNL